jgi:hypothetical protein
VNDLPPAAPPLGSPFFGGSGAPAPPPPPGAARLRVLLQLQPSSTPTVAMVPFDARTRVRDVVEACARLHALPMFFCTFVLRLPVDERAARGGATPVELPNQALVAPLELDTVELVRKVFADAPGAGGRALRGGGGGGGWAGGGGGGGAGTGDSGGRDSEGGSGSSGRRSARRASVSGRAAAGLLYGEEDGPGGGGSGAGGSSGSSGGGGGRGGARGSAEGASGSGGGGGIGGARRVSEGPRFVTEVGAAEVAAAAAYREWRVLKTNNRGWRQERILGVDLTRVVNKKRAGVLSLGLPPVTAERPISSILAIAVPAEDPLAFTITFLATVASPAGEGKAPVVAIPFSADTALEREEILAKFEAVLSLTGEQGKISRVAPGAVISQ